MALLAVPLSSLLLGAAAGAVQCPDQVTLCPVGNTCCPSGAGGYGCVSNEFPGQGTCCGDDSTACAAGYSCSAQGSDCVADDPAAHPLAQHTPRYGLCNAPVGEVYSLPLRGQSVGLAYYSTHGPLSASMSGVQAALVVVHGAGRNADDYFCVGAYAAQQQKVHPAGSVVVVAPWFVEPQDEPRAEWLTWNGSDANGVWRYGAQALPPARGGSFDAMDELLSTLAAVPGMKRIVLAGHSSGGQLVQRYALSSRSTVWRSGKVRAVVANPSSFAYLDGRRWISGALAVPNASACPSYDAWEWGLEDGEPAPYFTAAREDLGRRGLAAQYAARDVVYLVGESDVCNVTKGWCISHGLETTCADMLQGPMRRARADNYFGYLSAFYARRVHHQILVPGVGHDHALMFESAAGLGALFA